MSKFSFLTKIKLRKPLYYMVDIKGADANLLFTTLANWNEILQGTSIVNFEDYKATIDNTKKPPKAIKEPAKSTPVKALRKIGGGHGKGK